MTLVFGVCILCAYMSSAIVNVRVDPRIKNQAQKIASEMGLTLSAVVNGLLKHMVATRTVTFSAREEPSEFLIESLRKSGEDIKAGRVSPAFDNARGAIAWLRKPAKKYAGKI